ncbi:BTB/POZ domain-containing protein At3g09030-like [Neltuma alba]|uniref:BTB/POZ domain-containing protein At3g09030-like n=1 Tax=Neltuma alba TaxID=207710 RepID=UPI0010A2BBFE|nr:BTB/POZ domain-containing protein At3g09030-like [Prosopis alba]
MDVATSASSYVTSPDDRIKLNIGGKLFETTLAVLRSGGSDSLLTALSLLDTSNNHPVFIDRDPEIFSVLPSLLRTKQLPPQLVVSPSKNSPMKPFTTASTPNSDEIDSICRVWPEIAAIGSESNAGLHFYDFSDGRNIGTVQWTDPSDPRIFKARVNAIAGSESSIFAAFDCPHRENCVLEVDKTKLQIVSQLARQSGNQAKHTVPGKLTWVPQTSVIVGSAVTSGAFGYSGYIRLWDPRSGEVVWETNEPGAGRSSRFGDSFARVDVDVEGLALFKLCSQSGDLAMAGMRHLKEDPWIYLQERNPSLVNTGRVSSSVIHCYRKQAFVGREGDLEVWSRLEGMKNGAEIAGGDAEGLYRRNFVDKIENSERGGLLSRSMVVGTGCLLAEKRLKVLKYGRVLVLLARFQFCDEGIVMAMRIWSQTGFI